jgi:hypothetical protein
VIYSFELIRPTHRLGDPAILETIRFAGPNLEAAVRKAREVIEKNGPALYATHIRVRDSGGRILFTLAS